MFLNTVFEISFFKHKNTLLLIIVFFCVLHIFYIKNKTYYLCSLVFSKQKLVLKKDNQREALCYLLGTWFYH